MKSNKQISFFEKTTRFLVKTIDLIRVSNMKHLNGENGSKSLFSKRDSAHSTEQLFTGVITNLTGLIALSNL